MTKRHVFVTVGACAVLAAAVTIFLGWTREGDLKNSPHAEPIAPSAQEVIALRAELRALVQRVKLLELAHRVQVAERSDAPQRQGDEKTAELEQIDPGQEVAYAGNAGEEKGAYELDEREFKQSLEARLASEGVDADWSLPLTRISERLLAERQPESVLLGVDCRSTLCRATVRHDSTSDQTSVARVFGDNLPPGIRSFYFYNRDVSPPETSIYMLRSTDEDIAHADVLH